MLTQFAQIRDHLELILYNYAHRVSMMKLNPIQVDNLKPGEVLLLENARFYREEEENDPTFAQKVGDDVLALL
jgi:3-phosphoglycerate kinase